MLVDLTGLQMNNTALLQLLDRPFDDADLRTCLSAVVNSLMLSLLMTPLCSAKLMNSWGIFRCTQGRCAKSWCRCLLEEYRTHIRWKRTWSTVSLYCLHRSKIRLCLHLLGQKTVQCFHSSLWKDYLSLVVIHCLFFMLKVTDLKHRTTLKVIQSLYWLLWRRWTFFCKRENRAYKFIGISIRFQEKVIKWDEFDRRAIRSSLRVFQTLGYKGGPINHSPVFLQIRDVSNGANTSFSSLKIT